MDDRETVANHDLGVSLAHGAARPAIWGIACQGRMRTESEEKKTPFPSSLHFPRVEYGQESGTSADPFAVPIGGLLPTMELRSLALLAGLLMARAIAELNLLKASLRGLAMGHA